MTTLDDLVRLRNHDRVKFVGDASKYTKLRDNDPNAAATDPRGLPKLKKVYTVLWTTDNRLQSAGYIGAPAPSESVTITFYGGAIRLKIPAELVNDWEIVAYRCGDVETTRKSKLGVTGAMKTIRNLKRDVHIIVDQSKRHLDMYLKDILLDKKMKLLSELDGTDRIVADLLFEYKDMDEVLKAWDKGRTKDD